MDGQTTGVLLSGGLDSAILVDHLLNQGRHVQPFYIRSDVVWQREEETAARRFLQAIQSPLLRPLVIMEMPLADLYGEHWSVTGSGTPDARSPDVAVFLPGRNALLLVKAATWCQLNSVAELALAPLGTSPFADATPAFFNAFEAALNLSVGTSLSIVCPFDGMNKQQVMKLGQDSPLEHTFSCILPVGGLHCGQCNKCAERRSAFSAVGRTDPTKYAAEAA